MKFILGVDAKHHPVYFVIPENMGPAATRSYMMDHLSLRGEIYGLPVGPVRTADGQLTGDVGVELPAGASITTLMQLGAILDLFATSLTEYRN
jgi:hypothetical protein